jgi:hypothetical protein
MNINELEHHLCSLRLNYNQLNKADRFETVKLLISTTNVCLEKLRNGLHESDATTNRRKAKGRETELDPKPPISPVRVAAASKPKKPKYSGNHAPSERR